MTPRPTNVRAGGARRKAGKTALRAWGAPYAWRMRVTVSLEDRLAEEVRREATAQGLSVSAFIARIVDDALKRPEPTHIEPFRLITAGGEGLRSGVDLDRPRELETSDDQARYG